MLWHTHVIYLKMSLSKPTTEEARNKNIGNTYGSMLTGVVSLIADKMGGVMSQLSKIRNNTHPWTKLLTQLALKLLICFNTKGN